MFITSVIINCIALVVILRLWAALRSNTAVHRELDRRSREHIRQLNVVLEATEKANRKFAIERHDRIANEGGG